MLGSGTGDDPDGRRRLAPERTPHVFDLDVGRDGDLVAFVVEVRDSGRRVPELEALSDGSSHICPSRNRLNGQ